MTPSDEQIEVAAKAIAELIGPGWDNIHRDKAHWRETGGMLDGEYRDVNEPRQDEIRDAATAAITAYEAVQKQRLRKVD